jgi:hypothetical protein
MRPMFLVLPLLLALACKSDPGDEAGESSGSSTSDCGPADAAAVDPDYPPCDCDYKCGDDSLCRFSPTSSVCLPACTLGPTCKNPDEPCLDSDCPTLGELTATCYGGVCTIDCGNATMCPPGYVCAEAGHCQVAL